MSLLSLPTDNLYKFMALAGIIVFIISLMPFNKYYESRLEKIQLAGEIKTVRAEIDNYERKLNNILEVSKLAQTDIENLERQRKEIKHMDKRTFSKHLLFEEEMNKFSDNLFELTIKEYDNSLIIETKVIELHTRENRQRYIDKTIKTLFVLSILGFIIGVLLTIIGFILWYKKCQIYLDRSVKNINTTV